MSDVNKLLPSCQGTLLATGTCSTSSLVIGTVTWLQNWFLGYSENCSFIHTWFLDKRKDIVQLSWRNRNNLDGEQCTKLRETRDP